MSTSDWKLARVLDFEQHINPRDIQCHNERTGWTFYKHRAFFAPRKMHWLASEAKWDSLPSEEKKKQQARVRVCVFEWHIISVLLPQNFRMKSYIASRGCVLFLTRFAFTSRKSRLTKGMRGGLIFRQSVFPLIFGNAWFYLWCILKRQIIKIFRSLPLGMKFTSNYTERRERL